MTKTTEPEAAQEDNETKLKIAWRYENQAPKSEELTSSSTSGHWFNLNKVIKDEELGERLKKWTFKPDFNVDNHYNKLFKEIEAEAMENFKIDPNATNLLRIGIVDVIGSSVMSDNDNDLLCFLFRLKQLARSHLLVIVINLSHDFFARFEINGVMHQKVKELVDFVLDLTAFAKDKNTVFKDHHGLVELSKAAPLNCLVNSANASHIKSKHLFKSLRTKFSISPMHLPPELEAEVKEASNNLNKLEF